MARWMKMAWVAACLAPLAVEAGADEGWVQLFNGKDLTGWIDGGKQWKVEDGVLTWQRGCGYIWTKGRYGDFVLDLEFKISPKCNSGVFFRTADLSKVVKTGIEMQILDSHGKKPNIGSCGAIYHCLAPTKTACKKAGEWDRVTITCKDNQITVVMNGEPIIDMDLNQWTEAHKNPDGTRNKFDTAYKDMAREGHIGFQDHRHPVWFRNIRIKVLDK